MRRSLAFLGLLPFVFLACEDSGSGGSLTPTLDSGSPDVSRPVSDAGSPLDASPDAPAPTTVSVTITTSKGPKAGVRIVFHDATGAVTETKLTGADGKAVSTGTPAMASALLGSESGYHIVTWTGVVGGDTLSARDVEQPQSLGNYRVTPPGSVNGALGYEYVAGRCNTGEEGSVTATLAIASDCVGTVGAVLAHADSENIGQHQFGFKKGNALPSGGNNVEVTTSAWAAPTGVALAITNIDENLETELNEIADGVAFPSRRDEAIYTYLTATGFADALQATVQWSPNGSNRIQGIVKRTAPATTIAIDGANPLPQISSSSVEGSNAHRPTLRWSSDDAAGLARADGAILHVDYLSSGDVQSQWTFVVRPGATSVTAPAMPPEAAAHLPASPDAGSGAFFRGGPDVYYIESDLVPNYDAFRRLPAPLDRVGDGTIERIAPLPANGTVKVSVYYPVGA